jgi:hypothetical protein
MFCIQTLGLVWIYGMLNKIETEINIGRPKYIKFSLHLNVFGFSHSEESLLFMCAFYLRTFNKASDVWN